MLGDLQASTCLSTTPVMLCKDFWEVFWLLCWHSKANTELLKHQLLDSMATNRADYKQQGERKCFNVRGPDYLSFLLDPSFLKSFLPLENKFFFFLPCEEQSVR